MILYSCINPDKSKIQHLYSEWEGKEICFPSTMDFITFTTDDKVQYSWKNASYKILSYVDSLGCMSCKLQLPFWESFIDQVDSLCDDNVSVLLVMHPKDIKELRFLLKRDRFDYPVCIDRKDSLNKLNHFPSEMEFQTFLLDKDNKVLAIGNPVLNPGVKELYLKIIQGKPLQDKDKKKQVQTTVSLDTTTLSLGKFPWQEEQQATFTLKNTGDELLVIHDVVTSCGCLEVDYSPEPVRPGKEAVLHLTYKADYAGYVSKSVQVYCNAAGSPIKFRVKGEAE